MSSKEIARISCGFYEDSEQDMKLLAMIDKLSFNKRFRGQKIKELALEYIKLTMMDELREIELKETNINIKNEENAKVKKEVKEEVSTLKIMR